MKAVVVPAVDSIEVQEVTLDAPKAGEVKVKMAAAGVCHSDLSIVNGTIPATLPMVIGHEGAGVIEAVGEGVTNVAPGDHVILSFVPNCRECFFCLRGEAHICALSRKTGLGMQLDGTSRVHRNGTDLTAMSALGCMAPEIIAPSISVVPISKDIPLTVGALVGCGVTTGVGAVLNTAKVSAGSSVAVFGCGGVGLSAIQGARVAGATPIIAVDLDDRKLEMAKSFGATHTLNASEDVTKPIRKLTNGVGADYTFEAIGIPSVVEQAYAATRNGGTTVVVGIGKYTENVSFNALTLPLFSKTICGCMYGSATPSVDFPRMLSLYQAGKLDLEGMITKTYSIDEAQQAFDDLKSGVNARGVIVFD